MEHPELGALLAALASDEKQKIWEEFLQQYAPVIYQVAHAFGRDSDDRGECFLFACEELARNRCGRLRRFDPEGRAQFTTWLRAVVRNLCVDWHRKTYGRRRMFRSIMPLAALDQRVFRLCFQEQRTANEAYDLMRAETAGLTLLRIEESIERIRRSLNARQMWLLSTGQIDVQPFPSAETGEGGMEREPADPAPNPEALAEAQEIHTQLQGAMEKLEGGERLLLQLRFEENLTLREVARVLGLKDAQAADRQIRDVLAKLRDALGAQASAKGKTHAASV